jgi:hypothetical protein
LEIRPAGVAGSLHGRVAHGPCPSTRRCGNPCLSACRCGFPRQSTLRCGRCHQRADAAGMHTLQDSRR